MNEYRRLLLLVLIMAGVALAVGGVAFYALYEAAIDQQRARLIESAQSQARLLEAVAQFDKANYGATHTSEDTFAATLSQIQSAHEQFKGFGDTGEFTLAKLEDDHIIFLLSHRHYDLDNPDPVPFFSTDRAEPMRRALSGESGTVIGLDYRGETVLAAYEPVAEYNLGIVAKIDLTEVRQPFIRAGLLASGVGLVFVILGALSFLRISAPLIRKLEEREIKYRTLFEAAHDSIFVIEPETLRFIDANTNTARRLGYTKTELLQLTVNDILEPEVSVNVGTITEKLSQRQGYVFETLHRRKDGTLLPVEVSSQKVTLGNQAVYYNIVRDITERKRAAEELRTSEAKYRAVVEQSITGIYIFNAERYLYVNERFAELFGYTQEEILRDLRPTDVVAETDRALAAENVRRRFEGDIPSIHYSVQAVKKDGTLIWVDIHGTRITMDGETVITGAILDITERKQAEQALQRFNRRIALLHAIDRGIIASKTPEAIVHTTMPHIRQIFDCQRASLNLFNEDLTEVTFLADETMQNTVFALPSNHEQGLSERLQQFQQGHMLKLQDYDEMNPTSTLLKTLYDDGIRSSLSVPLLADERLVGTFSVYSTTPHHFTEDHKAIARDISDQLTVALRQWQLLERVESHAEELEQRVVERTTQLEAKTRELETFTYSVSHDLKAPLRGIDGYSRLLLEDYPDQLDEDGRTFLHNIQRATRQMNELIDDLLVYSRLERHARDAVQINVREVFNTLIAEVTAEAQQRGISLTTALPDATLSVDPEGYTMALRNLIDNALKFTAGTPDATIEFGGRETETSCILWVRDNGIGFDMQYHDRIFEIFQRLHRAEDYDGTGVGLAIVHKSVQRMGGRVWAESEPGQGATFYIELPR